MRITILVVLIFMAICYVLEHSYFIAGAGTILIGLAAAGCLMYALLSWHRR